MRARRTPAAVTAPAASRSIVHSTAGRTWSGIVGAAAAASASASTSDGNASGTPSSTRTGPKFSGGTDRRRVVTVATEGRAPGSRQPPAGRQHAAGRRDQQRPAAWPLDGSVGFGARAARALDADRRAGDQRGRPAGQERHGVEPGVRERTAAG